MAKDLHDCINEACRLRDQLRDLANGEYLGSNRLSKNSEFNHPGMRKHSLKTAIEKAKWLHEKAAQLTRDLDELRRE